MTYVISFICKQLYFLFVARLYQMETNMNFNCVTCIYTFVTFASTSSTKQRNNKLKCMLKVHIFFNIPIFRDIRLPSRVCFNQPLGDTIMRGFYLLKADIARDSDDFIFRSLSFFKSKDTYRLCKINKPLCYIIVSSGYYDSMTLSINISVTAFYQNLKV
jgi:hypothetical protein